MEFKINGKYLLVGGLLSMSLAFGEHIAVFNNGAVSHTESNAIENLMTVGSVVVRVDNINPSTIYGGNWELIQGDAALRLGDGTTQNGLVQGTDLQNIVLPKHSHEMNHTHTRGNMDFSGYFPIIITNVFQAGVGGAFLAVSNTNINQKSSYTVSANNNHGIEFKASRTWTGVTSQPSNTNTNEVGVDNASIDLKGAHINLNIWKRKS